MFFRVGVDCHLDFIDNGAKIRMIAGMENFPKMFKVETFIGCIIGYSYPGNIALPNVLNSRGTVDEIVNLSF